MIGIVHIEDETFITDRNNGNAISVDRVELRPTWDIDRAGSKGQVSVVADAGVLEAGMWLSTYRTITPERGEIIRFPRGHWHLSRPGISYPGGHEMDAGNVAVLQTASGSDIVDDISGVLLTESFYTVPGGSVMTDVRVLIKMASAGILTRIPVVNHSFEESLSIGWTMGYSNGAAGVFAVDPSNPTTTARPEGQRVWGPGFDTRPLGGYAWAQQFVDIPPGTERMMLVAQHYRYGQWYEGRMRLEFRDSGGSIISDVRDEMVNQPIYGWDRAFVNAAVPANAVQVRILLLDIIVSTSGIIWGRPLWDDVRLYGVTTEPLPDDRINLPLTDLRASTRIQTTEGKSIGYDAINADRLNAIGHNAIATDMDGRLTTQPIRTLANATAKYTFGPGDIELLDVVAPEISAITEKPFNHWRAVKEDFQDASASMAADSYNNNANDPFSVVNSGIIRSAPLITVQDAVSFASLQAMADAARDRYSLSETARFAIMPIADITVYDIVAIEDPDMPNINGLWAVNSIDASGDYLVVTATRAVSREV